jgi:hypothetical protein
MTVQSLPISAFVLRGNRSARRSHLNARFVASRRLPLSVLSIFSFADQTNRWVFIATRNLTETSTSLTSS